MNLIIDPWIPVVFEAGESGLVGLRQLYREAETIRDLNVNPPQRIALMRLLLCITQAALDGPVDEDDWQTCRDRIIPSSLDYLAARYDKFNLYGDQPFLQVKTLVPTSNESIEKLDLSLSSDLFNHTTNRSLLDFNIVLNLLTTQCFSLGGTIGVTLWGEYATKGFVKSGEAKGPGPSSDAPCAPSSMLHTIFRGSTLLDSVYQNLLTKAELSVPWGLPIWENSTSSPIVLQESCTGTFLGRLVPMSRGILLDSESGRCTYVAGVKYESLPNYREPMGTVLLNKKNEPFYMGIKLGQHLWRELASILSLNARGEDSGALALRKIDQLGDAMIDVWVGGVSRKPGQNLIYDTAEWNFSIPASMLGDAEIGKYSLGVELANKGELALKNATKAYRSVMKSESAGFARKATVHYWSTLDSTYQVLVDIASDGERDLDEWRTVLRKTMYKAFEEACPHDTPRQIQAYAQAKGLLRIREAKSGK